MIHISLKLYQVVFFSVTKQVKTAQTRRQNNVKAEHIGTLYFINHPTQ